MLGGLAGGGQRGERATVEAAIGADDAVATAATELARQLQRGLVRFGAAVAEEQLAGLAGGLQQQLVHLLRGLHRGGVGEQVADVQQLPGLMSERRRHRGVRVTQRRDCQATEEVEVPLAGDVPQLGARAASEHHLRGAEHRHERAVVLALRGERVTAGCTLTGHCTIVPIPSSVNTSNSNTCGMRPSRMWARRTPLRTA